MPIWKAALPLSSVLSGLKTPSNRVPSVLFSLTEYTVLHSPEPSCFGSPVTCASVNAGNVSGMTLSLSSSYCLRIFSGPDIWNGSRYHGTAFRSSIDIAGCGRLCACTEAPDEPNSNGRAGDWPGVWTDEA